MPLELSKADTLAARIRAELAPLCEKIEIAGSIRRRRPWVGDIDFVAVPHAGQANEFRARVKQNAVRVVRDGSDILTVVLKHEVQVEVYFAARASRDMFAAFPTNFGSVFLCRTGSKEHNIFLVEHAKKLGKVWNPHHGVYGPDGNGQTQRLACETEQDIFRALDLEFIPPEKRER